MKNVSMNLKGKVLTITVDLSKEFGVSSSGKSIIIASSEGNQSVEGMPEVKIGLNIYKANKWGVLMNKYEIEMENKDTYKVEAKSGNEAMNKCVKENKVYMEDMKSVKETK